MVDRRDADSPREGGRPRRKKKRETGLLIGVAVLTAGFYLLVNSSDAEPYFLTVDEAHAAAKALDDRPVRIKGDAVVGSYAHTPGSTVHTFSIRGEENVIRVRYDGNRLPDTFQMAVTGGREIVAEGRLGPDGVLHATEIVAKCPSKYEGGSVPEHYKATGTSPNG